MSMVVYRLPKFTKKEETIHGVDATNPPHVNFELLCFSVGNNYCDI